MRKKRSNVPAEIPLSRRERQIMDAVYVGCPATAREILERLADPPGYSTVRKQLSVLMEKGELKASRSGRALVYQPVRSRENAARSAIRRLVDTFFGGSLEAAVTGLLDVGEENLSEHEATELRRRISEAAGQAGKSNDGSSDLRKGGAS